MDETRTAQVEAVAALAEPTRRRLYDYVVRQSAPVSRDEAAAAVGVARATVAFHLDRLVDDGLLDVVFERRTGGSGPGARRPAKLSRRGGALVGGAVPTGGRNAPWRSRCPSGATTWPVSCWRGRSWRRRRRGKGQRPCWPAGPSSAV